MKVSELIELLQELKEQNGDVEVFANNECGSKGNIDEDDVYFCDIDKHNKKPFFFIDAF